MNQPKNATMKSFMAHGKPRARQAENGRGLRGHSEDDEEDHDRAYRLSRELDDRPQGIDALVFGGNTGEEAIEIMRLATRARQSQREESEHGLVQGGPLPDVDQANPVGDQMLAKSCSSCTRWPRSARFF